MAVEKAAPKNPNSGNCQAKLWADLSFLLEKKRFSAFTPQTDVKEAFMVMFSLSHSLEVLSTNYCPIKFHDHFLPSQRDLYLIPLT